MLATIVYLFSIFFFQARADSTGSVNLTATVAAIQPGPEVVIPGSSAGNATTTSPVKPAGPAAPQPKLNNPPDVSLDLPNSPNPVEFNQTAGDNGAVPVYATQLPAFSGHTDIKNAIIFIEVHSAFIRATTYADSAGNWSWTPADPLATGAHLILITAQDPLDSEITTSASYNFLINLPAGQKPLAVNEYPGLQANAAPNALFDILVKINNPVVAPGDEILATIKLINFGTANRAVDIPVEYTIKNSKGEIISDSSETVAVATKLSYLKTFTLAAALPNDTYTLSVHVPSKDVIASASDTFKVQGPHAIVFSLNGKVDYTVLFQALLALFFLFSLIAYFEYNRVIILSAYIKKVEEGDLSKES